MKIAQINITCGVGSTGKICVDISKVLTTQGIENYIYYAFGNNSYLLGKRYMSSAQVKFQALKSKVFGNYGFQSQKSTRKLIKFIKQTSPDIVHLHNLHGHNVNLEMLFSYFKENSTKLIWTFHDCWAFTGYCSYFDFDNCEKWKTGCEHCLRRKKYSFFVDKSRQNYLLKKELFKGLDLTIVTPSQWLADLVKQSFLKDYPVKVINNGINLDIFKPTQSNFREKYGISNEKYIVLGVAFNWKVQKGLDVFIELSKRLGELYQIVLVGTNDKIDKLLPANIVSIHRTYDQKELAGLYTTANVFVNPTREDNFPTVNIESIACGTPVVTFDTGGSPEILGENCGAVVPCDDVDALLQKIVEICNKKYELSEALLKRAQVFDKNEKFKEYIRLYEYVKK